MVHVVEGDNLLVELEEMDLVSLDLLLDYVLVFFSRLAGHSDTGQVVVVCHS